MTERRRTAARGWRTTYLVRKLSEAVPSRREISISCAARRVALRVPMLAMSRRVFG